MAEQNQTPTVTPRGSPAAAKREQHGRSSLLDIALLSRRRRRKLITAIEVATGRRLICYVSLKANIAPPDAFDLIRVLHGVESGSSITLLLDSPGGDVDSAEKMIHLLRQVCEPSSGPSGDLEVVIPYRAKSAATLIALGADRILMSDSSELGPIDPQVEYPDGVSVPALALIRAYESVGERCRRSPNNAAFVEELAKFDPVVVEMMRLAVSRSRECAERLLKRRGGNYTAAPAILVDVDRFPSHSQMVDWRTARTIGIPQVQALDRLSPLWQQYWRLYRQLSAASGERRILESRHLTILTR